MCSNVLVKCYLLGRCTWCGVGKLHSILGYEMMACLVEHGVLNK
jgi:hypothetical protein